MAGKVGFIGLGAMGVPMARNLIEAGVPLVVNDIDTAKTAKINAEVASSAKDVAAAVDRTIVIVETTEQAQSVIAGPDGIVFARGKATYGSEEIPAIAGRKSAEVQALYPARKHLEVVHRNDLVLL